MNYRTSFVTIFALSALLGACSAQEAPPKEEATQAIKKEEVEKETKVTQQVKVETKLLVKEEGGMFLDISYPVLSGMMNTQKQDTLNADFLALAKSIETQTRNDEKALVEEESTAHAGGSLEVIETLNTEQLISLNLTGYTYSGGANGTPFHLPFVYDVKEEKTVTLADLFEGKTLPEKALLDLVNETLTTSEYGDLLFEPITELKTEQKFYLTSDALVLTFDKYEYTAGAAGAPEVSIPKEKLPSLNQAYR